MGTALHTRDTAALIPIRHTLEAVRARYGEPPVHGVTPSLIAAGPGWVPATEFANGRALPGLLDAARVRWPGDPHVAGALAWKSYAYWVTLPAALGFAIQRVVLDVSAANMLIRPHVEAPFLEVGLVEPATTSAGLRQTLMEAHLDPVLDELATLIHVGRRTLLGSVASAVCYALLRASDVIPGSAVPIADEILGELGLADLVDFGPDAAGRLQVSRKTCCLAFALSTPKICSGCCIPSDRMINR